MAVLELFFFSVLFLVARHPGDAFNCTSCSTDTSGDCDSSIKCVAHDDKCSFVSSENTLTADRKSLYGVNRSCSNEMPTGNFYFDFGDDRYLDIYHETCVNRSCPFSYPPSPLLRRFENGKYCPKCYNPGYDYCYDNGTVFCKGVMAQCVAMDAEIRSDETGDVVIPFTGKGCVTDDVCQIAKNQSIRLGTFTYTFKTISCSKASSALSSLRRLAFTLDKKNLGLHITFFLPCFLGIFAVKILS